MNGFEIILPFLKPIEHLILDDSISEVMVNGPDRIFIEKAGYLEQVQGVTLGEKSLLVAVKNIAPRLGDDISESKPILDSRLPDGSRVAAVIPPCSLSGVTLTIRKFNSRHFELEDLIRAGTLDRPLANRLEDYVLKRNNVLISGRTGTGKSTLAGLLAKFIPDDERILLIEDTAELQLQQPNVVRLQLLNTDHAGTLSTIHANSAKQGLARFTSCVLQSGVELPYRAIKTNIGDSLDVVVHIERRPGRRFISEVLEINHYDPDADLFDYCVMYAKADQA
jgi:pilus assembly protein CpaF